MVLVDPFRMERISLARSSSSSNSASTLVMVLLFDMGMALTVALAIHVVGGQQHKKTIDPGRFRHRKTLKCQTRVVVVVGSVITLLRVLLLHLAIVAILNTRFLIYHHRIIRNHQGLKRSHRSSIIPSHKIKLQIPTEEEEKIEKIEAVTSMVVQAERGLPDHLPLDPLLRGYVVEAHHYWHQCLQVLLALALVVVVVVPLGCINRHLQLVVIMDRMAQRQPHATVMETSLNVADLLASVLVRLVAAHMDPLYLDPLMQT